MNEKEAKELIKKLEEYYKEPVMPVSHYCDALLTWGRKIEDIHKNGIQLNRQGHEWVHSIPWIIRDAQKSNLLYRMIYLKQKPRSKPCPIHKGRWSGIAFDENDCEYGCQLIGWIDEEKQNNNEDA